VARVTYDTMYHMKHPQVRRVRKLGDAVFRGAKSVYTFDVFPLTTDIRDSAAIFIISRRIVDRFKTGHHHTICVGETDSIVSEIRRHKRAKCAKSNEANAICVLREEDDSMRSNVIDDLVAARSFSCIRNVSKPINTAVIAKAKPATRIGQLKVVTGTTAATTLKAKDKKVSKNRSMGTKEPRTALAKDGGISIGASSEQSVERTVSKRPSATGKKQSSKRRLRVQNNADTSRRELPSAKTQEPLRKAKARVLRKSRTRSKLAA
jgi:hypothetical protein